MHNKITVESLIQRNTVAVAVATVITEQMTEQYNIEMKSRFSQWWQLSKNNLCHAVQHLMTSMDWLIAKG